MDKNESEQSVLYVYMMGTCSLIYEEKQIALKLNNSKVTRLLLVLLYAGDKGVTRSALLEMLYGREDRSNPSNSLRALVFRLRKLLVEAGLPDGDYISTEGGIYRWAGVIPLWVDVHEFKQLAAQALKEPSEEERYLLLQKTSKIYRGGVLPDMLGEEWVIYESVRCQELYFSCLRELFRLMKERREYEEMLELCNAVIDIYPFEEWQTVQIDCMIAMNRYQDAMKAYEDASVLYFEEFGVTPSGKMLAQFQILSGKIQYAQEAILDIQKSLSEKGGTNGPYYCSYPSFVDIYRIVKRIVERSGQSVFLMLCWICNTKNIPLENEKLIQESSACLQKAMSKSLRRGDVYTKHSANQFLLLLMGTNQESCALISDRIDRNYRNGSIERKTKIRYYALSVADVYQEDPEENSFQIKGDKKKNKVKHIAL